jgi:RimJ/RimL family protein N-acetyltransferase
VRLQALRPGDTERLMQLLDRNQDWFGRWAATVLEPNRDVVHAWLWNLMHDSVAGTRECFGVWQQAHLIGWTGLVSIRQLPYADALLWYDIDKDWAGQGYGTLAVSETVERAFRGYALQTIYVDVVVGNERSERLLASLGFREVGLMQRSVLIDETWTDQCRYQMTRGEWDV